MKKLFIAAVIIFGLAQAYAQEEGRLKIKTGFEQTGVAGYFDENGEYKNVLFIPDVQSILLEVSYEIFEGWEPGFKLRYDILADDSEYVTGLNRPVAEIKYTSPIGLGGFIDMYLPMGSEDVVGDEPEGELYFALFFDTLFYGFTFYGEVLFDLQFEGADNIAQNLFRFIIRPGYMILDNLQVYFETQLYLGLDVTVDGGAVEDSGGYVIRLKPGIAYQVLDMLKLEFGISLSVCGKSGSDIPGFIAWHGLVVDVSASIGLF